jgi:hypothetical protein
MWEAELMSYNTFPPLQAAESFNLDGIIGAVKKMNAQHPGE